MDEEYIFLKNVEKFGKKYCHTYLQYDISELETNWWLSLKYVLYRSFLRGRNDKLSNEYYTFTVKVLEKIFKLQMISLKKSFDLVLQCNKQRLFNKNDILNFKSKYKLGKSNSVTDQRFDEEVKNKNKIIKELTTKRLVTMKWDSDTYEKNIYLGNDKDIIVVLEILGFMAQNKERHNLYTYIQTGISKDIQQISKELMKLKGVKYKVSSLILRDIVLLNMNKLIIEKASMETIFPIDTWVKTMFKKIEPSSSDVESTVMKYIDKCMIYEIHPALFAAGLWYIGFHSLDITLNNFLRIYEIDEKKM